jgi:hypothetical protein
MPFDRRLSVKYSVRKANSVKAISLRGCDTLKIRMVAPALVLDES